MANKKVSRHPKPAAAIGQIETELISLIELRPHPRNYRRHPADQLAHLKQSLTEHGLYRNVVIARDGTILAGHGVVLAAQELGLESLSVVRLDIDPLDPKALKVLAADNELSHLAEDDDRTLTELLKEIGSEDLSGLLGTGYDEAMLAALAFSTRTREEMKDENAARAWAGLPAYEEGGSYPRLVVSFRSEEDRAHFLEETGIQIDKSAIKGMTWSTRWPWTDREDSGALRFEDKEPEA